ncbi:hypothetical protein [Streptomyces formicae]
MWIFAGFHAVSAVLTLALRTTTPAPDSAVRLPQPLPADDRAPVGAPATKGL